MKHMFRKGLLGLVVTTAVLGPAIAAPAAFAAGEPVSVVYETAYNSDAPIDGSYIAYARAGEPRDDLTVSYVIDATGVRFPYPHLDYVGTWDLTNSADVTYSFRFSADPGTPAEAYQYQIDNMNNWIADPANHLTGRSIETFSEDVKPLIDAFGGDVPVGVRGTVTVHIDTNEPGNGSLDFWLYERDTAAILSPVATTPLVVTEPELNAEESTPLCEVFDAYTVDGMKYTPTGFGRDTFQIAAAVTSLGDTEHYPQDKPGSFIVDNDDNIKYALSTGESDLDLSDAETAILAKSAGSYTVTASYTAEDGYVAAPIERSVTVLPKTDASCFTTSKVVTPPETPKPQDPKPTTPPAKPEAPAAKQQLANTGPESVLGFAFGGVVLLASGTALLAVRRRTQS